MSLIVDTPDIADPRPPRAGMVWIAGGAFAMGSEDFYPEEAPVREATVGGFWIDAQPVTNSAFAAFVEDTGFLTSAEIAPAADDYPDAIPEQLVPASLVFTP